MEKKRNQKKYSEIVQNSKDEFPPLSKPHHSQQLSKSDDKMNISSSNNQLNLESDNTNTLTTLLENDLNQDIFNTSNSTTGEIKVKKNNILDLELQVTEEKAVIDNHQSSFVHSMTPAIQKDYSLSQKFYNNTYHTPRSLALSWFKAEVSPEWRNRFIRDVSKAITAENETIVSNRDENKGEEVVNLIGKLKNKKMVRHDLILKMLHYFKKSEDNVYHLERLIKTEEKGYALGSADCLKDTFKVLQGEKMRDLLLLAICTEEIQQRVQNYQKISNEIYNKTKDNKDVIGSLSTDDYGNPYTLFDQSQKLKGAISQQLEENK